MIEGPSSAQSTHDGGKIDLYGGIALVLATIAALIVANSPFAAHYSALLQTKAEFRVGSFGLSKTLEHWINDGLMAIFFLLVALEIKREVAEGSLASMKKAALPIIAAIGGFLVPAALYGLINWGDAQALRGIAIPTATDIAFAIGICALLGSAVPRSLKTFLLALAIIDDLLAIIVIAIFYTDELSEIMLLLAGIGIAGLVALNLLNVRKPAPYVLLGILTWICVLKSGVHATLAGVAVGFAVPLARQDGKSLLTDMEHALKPWVSFFIVPVFAFANAGVSLEGLSLAKLAAPIPLGIIFGLFVGKQFGVFGATLAALRLGAERPAGATLFQFYGVSILTGVGFTICLFIGTLAYEDESLMQQVRLGVLVASALSALLGSIVLIVAARAAPPLNAGAPT